jgi:hypothetical protein
MIHFSVIIQLIKHPLTERTQMNTDNKNADWHRYQLSSVTLFISAIIYD